MIIYLNIDDPVKNSWKWASKLMHYKALKKCIEKIKRFVLLKYDLNGPEEKKF
jgi:hypothetical protein